MRKLKLSSKIHPYPRNITLVPMIIQLQQCTLCYTIKGMEEYYETSNSVTKRERQCIECRKTQMRLVMQTRRKEEGYYVLECVKRWWSYCFRRKKLGLPYLGGPVVTLTGLLELYGPTCFYCIEPLRLENPRLSPIDHVVPVQHPESHHDYSSVVPCCASCNRAKEGKSLEEWKGEAEAAWLWGRIAEVQHRVPEVMRFNELLVPG